MPPSFNCDVKTKIQAVREIVRNVSSDDIGLVLQHYDYNVELTVAAFLDGGACSIIDQWKKTSVKQQRAKRSKKSRNVDDGALVTCSQERRTGSVGSEEEEVSLPSYETRRWDQCSSEDSTTLSADSASDSRSVTSDSAVTGSSSGDQALDSGYETTTAPLNGHASNHLRSDTKKSVNLAMRKVHSASTASLIENSFNQLRARLDEREADLLLQLDTEREHNGTEPVFICHLNELLQAIERFGNLQTKVGEEKSNGAVYNDVNKDVNKDRPNSSQESLHTSRNDTICEVLPEEMYDHKLIKDDHVHQIPLHPAERIDNKNLNTDSPTAAKVSKKKQKISK